MEKNRINFTSIIIYILGSVVLIISFFYDVDGTGTPFSGDLRDTWPYVIKLKDAFFFDPTPWTVHFPLHYYLLSRLSLIIDNVDHIRFFYCFISLTAPFLFFMCLKEKYRNENLNNLLILSTIVLFTPSFIYSAIWANDNVSSYIFIFIGSYFFFKYENTVSNLSKKNKYLYICFFFFALACYSRQSYSALYALFLFYFFQKLEFNKFFLLTLYSLVLATPGIIFLYLFRGLFNQLAFSGNLFNTLLGNASSLFIYTFPIILINILFLEFKLFNLKKILIYFLISFCVFLVVISYSDINSMEKNGGVFHFFSNLIFGNYFLFYFIFVLNLILILIIFENPKDLIIIFSIIFVFYGMTVFQRYFEPLFLVVFFLFTQSKFKTIFLKNKTASLFLVGYHILYYLISVTDVMYLIKL